MGSTKSKNRDYDVIDNVESLDIVQNILHDKYKIPLEQLHNLTPLEIKNKYGDKLLLEEITNNNFKAIKYLVENYSVEVKNIHIFEACDETTKKIIIYLLGHFNEKIDCIENVLYNENLSSKDISELIKILITKYIDNYDKKYGPLRSTLLMIAIDYYNSCDNCIDIETIKFLLEHKDTIKTINKINDLGVNALSIATINGYTEIIDLLLDYGADSNIDVTKVKRLKLPKKFKILSSKDEINNCNERSVNNNSQDGIISINDIRNFNKVYAVKREEDDGYNCYSFEEANYILKLKHKNPTDIEHNLKSFNIPEVLKDFEFN
jgi:ankyrin repeat protein